MFSCNGNIKNGCLFISKTFLNLNLKFMLHNILFKQLGCNGKSNEAFYLKISAKNKIDRVNLQLNLPVL